MTKLCFTVFEHKKDGPRITDGSSMLRMIRMAPS